MRRHVRWFPAAAEKRNFTLAAKRYASTFGVKGDRLNLDTTLTPIHRTVLS
jgi:hypothetical protein